MWADSALISSHRKHSDCSLLRQCQLVDLDFSQQTLLLSCSYLFKRRRWVCWSLITVVDSWWIKLDPIHFFHFVWLGANRQTAWIICTKWHECLLLLIFISISDGSFLLSDFGLFVQIQTEHKRTHRVVCLPCVYSSDRNGTRRVASVFEAELILDQIQQIGLIVAFLVEFLEL